jgi:hypothetical protein
MVNTFFYFDGQVISSEMLIQLRLFYVKYMDIFTTPYFSPT